MIPKYYKLLTDRIDNLLNISKGNDQRSRFFNAQVNQLDSIFHKLMVYVIEQKTENRDLMQCLVKERDQLKKENKYLKSKLGIKSVIKGFNDKTFPFIK